MSAPQPPDSTQARIANALREARERLDAVERERHEPIAVVGLACRYPGGADTPDAYWQVLKDGIDAVGPIPADRWSIDEYYDPDQDAPGKMYVREGAFLGQVDQFDPQFFRISPREAISLDPQQRLLLEVVWESLENAGYASERLRGTQTGIYMGLSWHDYERDVFGVDGARLDAYAGMGNTPSIAVGRLAYFLGVHGPTMQLDTACSASLVSVHVACQALRAKECEMAIAGGVNLMISPLSTIFCCRIQALAPDNRCKTFDASANGYGRGEGCGAVVLKRLSDALAADDYIHALVRGTAANQDGPSSGLTVPNRRAQQWVIEKALASGRVKATDVAYVEAHGTGTSLGDPIEIGALGDALSQERRKDRPLLVGSAKTNVGHLEAAAGIAGLTKVVLSLEHGKIPKHLHLNEPSPRIDWDNAVVEVPTETRDWPDGPKIAGVSSFGFSGTNAHVVLEEAPVRGPVEGAALRPEQMLLVSGKSEGALAEAAGRYARYLRGSGAAALSDVCFTAAVGRSHFEHRVAVLGEDAAGLCAGLEAYQSGGRGAGVMSGTVGALESRRVAFLYTGQGAQRIGMGQELYAQEKVFREALERCDAGLREVLGESIIEVMHGDVDGRLDETRYTQAALFSLEWSLTQLWSSWGVVPSVVLGHSVGEYVAACVAGVFSVEDGLKLIGHRGRLMQALPREGSMAVVFAGEEAVREVLGGQEWAVSVAAVNGPRSCVISGRTEVVEELVRGFEAQGVDTRELRVSHAFHSPLMEPMLEEYGRIAAQVSYGEPRIGVVSNVSGALAEGELGDPGYWVRHVREAVRFAQGVQVLDGQGCELYVEVGPSPTLVGMARGCVEERGQQWLSSLRPGVGEVRRMQETLGALHVRGVGVDWGAYHAAAKGRRVPLPTYPFQRRRFWVESSAATTSRVPISTSGSAASHPLLGGPVRSVALGVDTHVYETVLSAEQPRYLGDHVVFGQVVVPGTAFFETALAAAVELFSSEEVEVADLIIQRPLTIPEGEQRIVQCVLNPSKQLAYRFEIHSRPGPGTQREATGEDGQWIAHVKGTVRRRQDGTADTTIDLEASRRSLTGNFDPAVMYERFAAQGLALGPRFHAVKAIHTADGHPGSARALVHLELPSELHAEAGKHLLHPVLLDACGQCVGSVLAPDGSDQTYLPIGLDRLRFYHRPGRSTWATVERRPLGDNLDSYMADVRLFDDDGRLVAALDGLVEHSADREALLGPGADLPLHWIHHLDWIAQPLPPADEEAGTLSASSGTVVILGDTMEIGSRLKSRLEIAGGRCLLIRIGSAYRRLDDSHFEVPMETETGLHQVFTVAKEDGMAPCSALVNLCSLEAPGGLGANLDEVEQSTAFACRPTLHLLQVMEQLDWANAKRFVMVTRSAQWVSAVAENGLLSPAQATGWGMGRTLGLERPDLSLSVLDLPADDTPADNLAAIVEAELASTDGETQVAIRNGERYVARVRPVTDLLDSSGDELLVRDDATYLITGGLGALGLMAARWLVGRGARHLALVGRREPGEAAHEVLEQLESDGARWQAFAVDTSDVEAMASLFEQLDASMPTLKGVLHAAGVLDDGALAQQDWSRFLTVMAPKVRGTWNLHQQTCDRDLDFFVCFSSAASLLGSPGQGNYAAANAYQDAIAHWRAAAGLPALTVNWGPWAEAGMAKDLDERGQRRLKDQGWDWISPPTGFALLDYMLRSRAPQRAALPLNWNSFVRTWGAGEVPSFAAELVRADANDAAASQSTSVDILESLRSAASDEREEVLLTYLIDAVAAVVGLSESERPSPDQALSELGLDSLMFMELRSRLQSQLEIDVAIGDFLSSPSARHLAGILSEKTAFAALSGLASEESPDDEDLEEMTL